MKNKEWREFSNRHQHPASHLSFTDTGLISASKDVIYVWHHVRPLATLECSQTILGPQDDIIYLECSDFFIAVATKSQVLVWKCDTDKNEFISPPQILGSVNSSIVSLTFGPSHTVFVTSTNSAKLFSLETSKLLCELPCDKVITASYWDTSNSLVLIGNNIGILNVYAVSNGYSRYELIGECVLKHPIVNISASSLGVLVATAESVLLFRMVGFEPSAEFKITTRHLSSLAILSKSLVWSSGECIKFWNSLVKRKIKASKPAGRKVRYSRDKNFDSEVQDIVNENRCAYEDRVERHSNVVEYNGVGHGMSDRELEDFAVLLSIQDSQREMHNEPPPDLTEEEWLQIVLDLSKNEK